MNSELVKQAQKDLKKRGIKLSREKVYQELVKQGFIDKFGNPTEWAFENGLISQTYTFPQGMEEKTQEQDERDIENVLSRLPQDSIKYSDNPNLSGIKGKPLKKAIMDALKDGSLSQRGRIKWAKTLQDVEERGV